MIDDRIRISDADRERAAASLREHFAQGRLSSDELDERISAALSAKTVGDLRPVMADLPGPAPVAPPTRQSPPRAVRHAPAFRRGPRLLPLAILALVAALVIPGASWAFLAFLQLVLALWLVACLAGIFTVARFRRHMRHDWRSGDYWGPGDYWRSRDHWRSGDGTHWRLGQ
jgi:uncharacterized protein DUF1707